MAMNELARTAEYNVFWEDSLELEFDPWVSRAEAEGRIAEIEADPERAAEETGLTVEEVQEAAVLVRRWRVEYIDDDWDYLRSAQTEEAADDERAQANEVRLALED